VRTVSEKVERATPLTVGTFVRSHLRQRRQAMRPLSDDPVQLSDEERTDIAERMATCPFVGTAVATGVLQVLHSAAEPLASIEEIAALGDTGGGDLGTHVLKLFARGNHARRLVQGSDDHPLVPPGTFNLQFGGSQGAHAGHSGILLGDPEEVGRGRFDEAAFERLVGHADEHGRLSIDAVGDFIADNLKRDPNAQVLPAFKLIRDATRLLREFKDVVLGGDEREKTEVFAALTKLLGEDNLVGSAGEWGLLFAFLKNSPNSDDGDISLGEVRKMFVDKAFPVGWETWEKSAFDWIKATLRLTKDAAFAHHVGWE
jgi:hypothetical protein